jgi:hypothetical protein
VQKFLAEKNIPVITQPRFATMEDINSNATAELQKFKKEAFHRCFQQWQDRWSKCVCAQGSYFERD